MKKIQELRLGALTVLSEHPVLNQVAHDLVAGLRPDDLPAQKITVYVGLHRGFALHLLRTGKKIAIQTEHYFDADGCRMSRRTKRLRTLINTMFCDKVLDLSPYNKDYYAFLPNFLRKRIIFGPHIFPSAKRDFKPGMDHSFIFFGAMNDRREKVISFQPSGAIKVLSSPTFGHDLSQLIANAAGIVNLHYFDGRYSETPRLLTACLSGKVIMSEMLGDELVPNRDYLLLGNYPTENGAREVYDNFWENFAQHHSFAKFLNEIAS